MWILCWTTKKDGCYKDYYTVLESLSDAATAYDNVTSQTEVYSASICKPIVSTEPHYVKDLEQY